jgi:hypothetical protein
MISVLIVALLVLLAFFIAGGMVGVVLLLAFSYWRAVRQTSRSSFRNGRQRTRWP